MRLPENVGKWVLVESCDVFEDSPFLGIVSWLGGLLNELSDFTIGFFSQGSVDHLGTFVNVGVAPEKTLNTS